MYIYWTLFGTQVLRTAINTVGTDEDALSRVIITRAEKDLKDIMKIYFRETMLLWRMP